MRSFIKFLSLLLLFGLVLVSCSEDYDQLIDTVDNIPKAEELIYSKFSGVILDVDGNPIESAYVAIAGENTLSDINGYFSLEGLFNKDGENFKVSKLNYFDGYGVVLPIEDATIQIRIILTIKEKTTADLSSDELEVKKGLVSIAFASDAYTDLSGNRFDGMVNVFSNYIDPSLDNFAGSYIGPLETIIDQNRKAILPYGIIDLELLSDMDEPLQLSKKATITFEIPESLRSQAEAEIAMWYRDDFTGLWIKKGTARLEGSSYVGEIDHIAAWSVGTDWEIYTISGQVTRNDVPYSYAEVSVTYFNWYRRNTLADEFGRYRFKIFNLTDDYTFDVRDNCSNILYEEKDLPPPTTDFEKNVLFNSTVTSFTITGQVTCGGDPIGTSYVIADFGNSGYTQIIQTDNEGRFQFPFEDCSPEGLLLRGYDQTTLTKSIPLPVNMSGSYDIDICAESFAGEIVFEVDGEEPYVIDNCKVVITDEGGLPLNRLMRYSFEAVDNFGGQGDPLTYTFFMWYRNEFPHGPLGPINDVDNENTTEEWFMFTPAPYVINFDIPGIVEVTFSQPALYIRMLNLKGTELKGTIRVRALIVN